LATNVALNQNGSCTAHFGDNRASAVTQNHALLRGWLKEEGQKNEKKKEKTAKRRNNFTFH
jgi:hypothetical protein